MLFFADTSHFAQRGADSSIVHGILSIEHDSWKEVRTANAELCYGTLN